MPVELGARLPKDLAGVEGRVCGSPGGRAGKRVAPARLMLFFLPSSTGPSMGTAVCFPWASLRDPGRPVPRASHDPRYSFTQIERALPAGPD